MVRSTWDAFHGGRSRARRSAGASASSMRRRCSSPRDTLARRWLFRQKRLGIERLHVGLLVEEAELDERARQGRERLVVEFPVAREHRHHHIVSAGDDRWIDVLYA